MRPAGSGLPHISLFCFLFKVRESQSDSRKLVPWRFLPESESKVKVETRLCWALFVKSQNFFAEKKSNKKKKEKGILESK